ncbi:unnamed protein product [Ixodes pacificus]
MASSRPTVFVSRNDVPHEAIDLLKKTCNLKVVHCMENNWKELWAQHVYGMNALYIQSYEKIDAETLNLVGPSLQVVSTLSAGHEHIDRDECRKRNVHVGNTPHVQDDAVAEFAVALTLAASRRMFEGANAILAGNWTLENWGICWMLGPELVGKVVGIVGLGGIGLEIVNRLRAFKVRSFLYYNRRPRMDPLPHDIQYSSFKHLLVNSDIVIASCPLNPESRHMFNEKTFRQMKPTSIFVNVSRGEIVDQDALYEALKSNVIAFAATDTTTPEPLPENHPLLKLKNCIVTPHMAADSKETKVKTALMCAENILAVLEDKYRQNTSLLC